MFTSFSKHYIASLKTYTDAHSKRRPQINASENSFRDASTPLFLYGRRNPAVEDDIAHNVPSPDRRWIRCNFKSRAFSEVKTWWTILQTCNGISQNEICRRIGKSPSQRTNVST